MWWSKDQIQNKGVGKRHKPVRMSKKISHEIIKYQPDAVEIEERPLPGKIRWVLYVILFSIVFTVACAIIFKVDRIVVSEGSLITTSPTITLQPLNIAVVRSIDADVGDIVEAGQVLATLDSTFASADLSQLIKKRIVLEAQLRRIQAELHDKKFIAQPEEGDDGRLQEQLYRQRKIIFTQNKKFSDEKIAGLRSKLVLTSVQRKGLERRLKLFRDVEGTTAKLPQTGNDYRLKLLEAQKNRYQTADDIDRLVAEEQVTIHELGQAKSEWQRFVEERIGELMEQEVELRNELESIVEELTKAKRLHDLVSIKAPQPGIVLSLAKRSIGSIIQQAEPFITLVPLNSTIEVEVKVQSKDIARIRTGDPARVKLDAFPFQRHDTLSGSVRVISEDSFQEKSLKLDQPEQTGKDSAVAFYHARIRLLSDTLRNVPEGFRLLPGMKARAEIKVGKRRVITYFLYPIIRALDESLREP